MTHDLKTWPEFFDPLLKGEKRFELREEDDRVFHAGDTLRLREWSKATGYTGREVRMDVTYLISGPMFGLARGHVCLSVVPSNDPDQARAGSPSPEAGCSLFLVLLDGVPFAAYPRRKQAEVYASGFSKPTEIVEGIFTANAEHHARPERT